jgi:hypothetical protein
VTLITGASAGIGAALAHVFAERGHEVVLVARRGLRLNALADRIAAAGHTRPQLIALDLLRADATSQIENELHGRGLEAQIVVNNAGYGLLGPAAELDRAAQLAMIDLNVRVLTDLSLRFVDSLARHRGGILNVASVSSFLPGPGMAIYHATKAYVLSFGEALNRELEGKGIRVTTLCPGPVATEFQRRAGMPRDYFPAILAQSAEQVARDGYRALMRGQRLVVPGIANKVTAFLPRLLPRSLALKMVVDTTRRDSK